MESEAAAAAALPPLDVIKRILADARARRNVAKPGKRRGERAPRAQAA